MEKKCRRCEETKPLNKFYIDNSQKDKHNQLCKICHTARSREYYWAKKDLNNSTIHKKHLAKFKNYIDKNGTTNIN